MNVACSLSSSSPLDKRIKNMLMTDLFHMIGIVPFDRKRQQARPSPSLLSRRATYELMEHHNRRGTPVGHPPLHPTWRTYPATTTTG